ncbi:MAG TPA: T9SS type A sorting domain-containing protein, partial [Ignavibacteria bacterium]
FNLYQNYPNPFNPATNISFALPKSSFVKLVVYDILGREIAVLVNEQLKPGTYEIQWDSKNFSSGVYIYKLAAGEFVNTKKMVLTR